MRLLTFTQYILVPNLVLSACPDISSVNLPNNTSITKCKKKGTKCIFDCDEYGHNLFKPTKNKYTDGFFQCKNDAWKRHPWAEVECKKNPCFAGYPLYGASKSFKVLDARPGYLLGRFLIKKQYAKKYDFSKGWTLVLELAEPLKNGSVRSLNAKHVSANLDGSVISAMSSAHNRDLNEIMDSNKFGVTKYFQVVFEFKDVLESVVVKQARIYSMEFSNTACLTDGGSLGLPNGDAYHEDFEVPMVFDGIDVDWEESKCGGKPEMPEKPERPHTPEVTRPASPQKPHVTKPSFIPVRPDETRPVTMSTNPSSDCVCPEIYSPVECVSNNSTTVYSNGCFAKCAGLGKSDCRLHETVTKPSITRPPKPTKPSSPITLPTQPSSPITMPTQKPECVSEYIGCYIDPIKGVFDMAHVVTKDIQSLSGEKTVTEFCITSCQELGYKYAGINRGIECYCDNDYGTNGEASSAGECDSRCDVDGQCGGSWRLSVHSVCSDDDAVEPTSTPNNVKPTGPPTDSEKTTTPNKPIVSPPAGNMTDLERYISTTDSAYEWKDNNWKIYGEDYLGLADYNWITLTSQQYLSTDFVDAEEGLIWKHNVIICAGEISTELDSADFGTITLSGYGVGPDIEEYPRRKNEVDKVCKQAAQLGTVGVILDGIPTSVKFNDADAAESEGFQITGAKYFFDGEADISAIPEFPEAKAISMTMNMVDEYLMGKGVRKAPITRWSVTGGSKRGGATLAVTAAEPRVAMAFPVIQNVFHAMPEVFQHDLNCLGGYNNGWGGHYRAGWYRWFLTPSEKRDQAELSLNLNKYHKERITNVPMQFLLGSNDRMMHLDNINVWWDNDWTAPQKSSLYIQPNAGHSGGDEENFQAMHIMAQALIKNEIDELPYMEWSYSDDNTLKICIHRPTAKFYGSLYWGQADNGRDFRGGGQNDDNFSEIGSCDGSSSDGENVEMVCGDGAYVMTELGNGCFGFEDTHVLAKGEYSAMFMTIAFETEYESPDGDSYDYMQSTGPLVRPNTLPFAGTCVDNQNCDLSSIDRA